MVIVIGERASTIDLFVIIIVISSNVINIEKNWKRKFIEKEQEDVCFISSNFLFLFLKLKPRLEKKNNLLLFSLKTKHTFDFLQTNLFFSEYCD